MKNIITYTAVILSLLQFVYAKELIGCGYPDMQEVLEQGNLECFTINVKNISPTGNKIHLNLSSIKSFDKFSLELELPSSTNTGAPSLNRPATIIKNATISSSSSLSNTSLLKFNEEDSFRLEIKHHNGEKKNYTPIVSGDILDGNISCDGSFAAINKYTKFSESQNYSSIICSSETGLFTLEEIDSHYISAISRNGESLFGFTGDNFTPVRWIKEEDKFTQHSICHHPAKYIPQDVCATPSHDYVVWNYHIADNATGIKLQSFYVMNNFFGNNIFPFSQQQFPPHLNMRCEAISNNGKYIIGTAYHHSYDITLDNSYSPLTPTSHYAIFGKITDKGVLIFKLEDVFQAINEIKTFEEHMEDTVSTFKSAAIKLFTDTADKSEKEKLETWKYLTASVIKYYRESDRYIIAGLGLNTEQRVEAYVMHLPRVKLLEAVKVLGERS